MSDKRHLWIPPRSSSVQKLAHFWHFTKPYHWFKRSRRGVKHSCHITTSPFSSKKKPPLHVWDVCSLLQLSCVIPKDFPVRSGANAPQRSSHLMLSIELKSFNKNIHGWNDERSDKLTSGAGKRSASRKLTGFMDVFRGRNWNQSTIFNEILYWLLIKATQKMKAKKLSLPKSVLTADLSWIHMNQFECWKVLLFYVWFPAHHFKIFLLSFLK